VKTANFEVLTSAGEKSGRGLALHFEQVRSFFLSVMGNLRGAFMPVHIVCFSTDKEFEPFRPNKVAGAYYAGGSHGDYIVMKSASTEYYPVAVHEYVHLLIRNSGARPPLWWNEGLAELFSTLKPIGNQVEVGGIIDRRYQTLMNHPLIDLAEIMTAAHSSALYNDPDKAGMFYAESWALAHMFNISDQYRPKLKNLNSLLDMISNPSELFGKAYGKTVAQVQKDLDEYMHGLTFKAVRYGLKLEKSAQTPDIGEASDVETQVAFAYISMTGDRRLHAREILNGLSQKYPSSWEAQESLGYLNSYDGKMDEARANFGRAIENGASNPRTFANYFRMQASNGAPRASLIATLEKGLQLQPDDKELNLNLASLYLADKKYAAAVEHILKVGRVTTAEAFRTYSTLAYAHVGMNEFEKAKQDVEAARPYAHSQSEISELERLLNAIGAREQSARIQSEQARNPQPPAAAPPTAPPALPGAITPGAPVQSNEPRGPEKIKGKLQRFDCLCKLARIIVESDGKQIPLLIVDPSQIQIKGKQAATVAFDCGPQPETPVIIEYYREQNNEHGTAGRIVSIEFI
jgi:Flp pilus assembly protein TadD